MSLRVCSLSSGSTGNSIYLASETTRILIDAGINYKRIERSLKVLGGADNLSILVTHTHSDHVSNLAATASSLNARVYVCENAGGLPGAGKYAETRFSGEFTIGDISVTPFRVSHDVPCVGYTLRTKDGKAVSLLTDLGEVDSRTINALKDSDIVFIESNHDEGMVARGRYPVYLKRRILSGTGHLSNNDCAAVCKQLIEGRVKQIILGHLSKENNYPELAFKTVSNALAAAGCVEGKDVSVEVAPGESMSSLFEVF